MYIYTILEYFNQVCLYVGRQSVVFRPFPAIIAIGELCSLLASGMLASAIGFSLANQWLTRRLFYMIGVVADFFITYLTNIDY